MKANFVFDVVEVVVVSSGGFTKYSESSLQR